ncbi:MAG: ABC transporter permease subunit [Planctomycetota bacterium]|nr:MAG: ABC transporter permease subunit [Planctomycetota bacterium]
MTAARRRTVAEGPGEPQESDGMLRIACASAAGLSFLVLGLIVAFMVAESVPVWREIGLTRMLTDPDWHPTSGTFGLGPMIAGSVSISVAAVAVAAPIGLGAVLWARYYGPWWLGWCVRGSAELLAGIPSVVFGLWGLTVVVPQIARHRPPGLGVASAAIVLALMVIPTAVVLLDAAVAELPGEWRSAAAAAGMGRRRWIWHVVLPAVRPRLILAVILQTARGLGETIAVLMVCGNVVQWPTSPFVPVRTLTTTVALEMPYAMGTHRAALFACGVILLAVVEGLLGVGWAVQRVRATDGS